MRVNNQLAFTAAPSGAGDPLWRSGQLKFPWKINKIANIAINFATDLTALNNVPISRQSHATSPKTLPACIRSTAARHCNYVNRQTSIPSFRIVFPALTAPPPTSLTSRRASNPSREIQNYTQSNQNNLSKTLHIARLRYLLSPLFCYSAQCHPTTFAYLHTFFFFENLK